MAGPVPDPPTGSATRTGPRVRVGHDLTIRRCRAADLPRWLAASPAEIFPGERSRRFERSERGDSVYLLGWLNGRPVAQAEVLLTGCAAPEVRERLGIVTEIKGVEVLEAFRRRGIGTAIIEYACALTAQRGIQRAGLGVATSEAALAGLYRRLGFTDGAIPYVATFSWTDGTGTRRILSEEATFLVRAWS